MILPDKIIRSNRRTLSISVDSFGRLIVRAPKRYGEERIFAFLRQKESWILRKKAERAGAGIQLPPENIHGYRLLFVGSEYEICVTETKKVYADVEEKKIYVPMQKSQEKLVRWLKEQALNLFLSLTEKKSKEMGVAYKSVKVTSARSRWGCCTAENALRFSYRLLYAPLPIIEYVVVHELAHTIHKNHSPYFWREVEKYIPAYKIERKWLKIHSALMEIF